MIKILTYIWRNIRRNKVRSLLTVLSVGFSLALMTVLYGYMAAQETWSKDSVQYNRIVVMNTQGFSGEVPIASVDKVRGTENVSDKVLPMHGTAVPQPLPADAICSVCHRS